MDYIEMMSKINYLYHASCSVTHLLSCVFKWELSPDIVEKLRSSLSYNVVTGEMMSLFDYPVEIDYSKTNYIKLWCEVK